MQIRYLKRLRNVKGHDKSPKIKKIKNKKVLTQSINSIRGVIVNEFNKGTTRNLRRQKGRS